MLVARHAMATRFELVLYGSDVVRLRAVAEEALDEIDRIENLLSLYRPGTDIARINASEAKAPIAVTPETFRLLERSRALAVLTQGAFDITLGALVHAWGFTDGHGTEPKPTTLAEARESVGWRWIELDSTNFSVRLLNPKVKLDLGGIGKGYALDRAAAILRDARVEAALLHGGTSTVVAVGFPPGRTAWSVALPNVPTEHATETISISLRDESLSVSAPWGKSFINSAGNTCGHIVDPVAGQPGVHWQSAAVAVDSGTDSDALSTALSVAGAKLVARILMEYPKARLWLGSVPLHSAGKL